MKGPTRMERMLHEITHLPYRPWCRHCVEGRGRSRYHSQHLEDRSGETPVVGMDFASLGPRETVIDREEESAHDQLVPFLAINDRVSKARAAIAIPTKSVADTYARDKTLKTLEGWGRTDVVLRCDQEDAIRALRRGVAEARIHSTIPEDAPVGEHQANGDVESAIGVIGGQVRTMRAALQHKLGVEVDHRTPITRWLIDYSGELLTRFNVGQDGKTPFERLKGRRFRKELVEFGEQVMYEIKAGNRQGKMESKFAVGTFLGLLGHEYVVADATGLALTTMTIKRRAPEDMWNAVAVAAIRGLPWDWRLQRDEPGVVRPAAQEETTQTARAEAPRALKLTKAVLRKYEYTDGCPGCRAVRTGVYTGARDHTAECRTRIEKAIEDEGDPFNRLQAQRDRRSEYESSYRQLRIQAPVL